MNIVLCFRLGVQSGVQQEGRHAVHHQREPLLLPGAGVQRCRLRRRAAAVHQEPHDGVAGDVAQLGVGVAVHRRPQEHGGQGALVPRRPRRRQLSGVHQRRPGQLAVRADLRRKQLTQPQ
jgi:hypothetical protein